MNTVTLRRMGVFADRLRAAMELREVTQSELQRRLTGQGFDAGYSTIQAWYHGRSEPELRYARAIADALDVALDYLTGTSDDPNLHHRPTPGIEFREELAAEIDRLMAEFESLKRRLG